MKRPKIISLLSAALGSTTAFLALSRWGLMGTVSGALLMPVIFTLVSFWSGESMERLGKWAGRKVKKEPGCEECDALEDGESPKPADAMGWRSRSLQWSVVTLAFLAFAFSLYSLTQEHVSGVTILREKVVETVTVSSEQPTYTLVRAAVPDSPTTTSLAQNGADSNTTTTVDASSQEDTTPTTVPTSDGSGTTTTLP